MERFPKVKFVLKFYEAGMGYSGRYDKTGNYVNNNYRGQRGG